MTSADVLNAILAARSNPANASFFASNPSNYLGGMKNALTTGQLQAVTATGTVNVLAGGIAYHVTPGTGSQPFNYTPVGYDPNYYANLPSPPTPTNTLVPSNTSSPGTGRNLTSSISDGLNQVKGILGPVGILIGIGLFAFVVLKK
ncbi:MAG: hypothetical protein KGI06_06145 [Candidatus Micrarchaeota archaeon]|nr:hypothetical protein [Candidatus Micrarchaeota archaeon]